MIRFDRSVCNHWDIASGKEWLETNGLGGYAAGTVAGANTRAYHALLVAPLDIPLHRVIMLSQLEETVVVQGKKYFISTHHYRDTVAPTGYLNLEEFRLDPFPVFTYRLAELVLEKTIFMTRGKNLTWITYNLLTPVNADQEIMLIVRPLVNFRDHHLRRRERSFINTHHDLERHVVRLLPNLNLPTLNLHHNAQGYEHSALWYHNLFYRKEHLRGLECEEDLFSPGVIHYNLAKQSSAFLAISTELLKNADPEEAAAAERERRGTLAKAVDGNDPFGRALVLAADQFIVQRGEEGVGIIAGYPWLDDSGRDALIAMPGLLLSCGRIEESRRLLKTLAGYCSDGMLPNHFTEDHNQPMYNNVDVALWFFIAVHFYRQIASDTDFIREHLWTVMGEILAFYQQGTRYHIRMDEDGLITMPEEGAQLTWMDSQIGDWVVTPRSGKPIEINALWYNALCIMRDLAGSLNEAAVQARCRALAEKVKTSFNLLYWNEKSGFCFDRIEDHFSDPTLRPNQLLALSLPYPLIDGDRARQVLDVIRKQLVTPYGLRTLNRDNDNYHERYEGDLFKREGAAYQGTVWPWLIGPYADALVNSYGSTPQVKQELRQLLKPFEAHLEDVGLGSISEMFDGDPPHTPRGCMARSLSVAEILRVHMKLKMLS